MSCGFRLRLGGGGVALRLRAEQML